MSDMHRANLSQEGLAFQKVAANIFQVDVHVRKLVVVSTLVFERNFLEHCVDESVNSGGAFVQAQIQKGMSFLLT